MPRTTAQLYASMQRHGLSPSTFGRLYKPTDTPEGVSVTPPLFATPSEIKAVAKPVDSFFHENDVWAEKVHENIQNKDADNSEAEGGWGHGGGVLTSMSKKGWDWNHRVPIGLQGVRQTPTVGWSARSDVPVIANAQHRLAAADILHPNQFIPMVHYENKAPVFGEHRLNPNA